MSRPRISFEGQVAIVTGAGRGMGRDYALELARRGACVVVNDAGASDQPGKSRAEVVAEEILADGGRAVACADDVSTAAGGQAITSLALEAFGTVDIVINNAGMLRRGMFEDLTPEHFREVIDVHLTGAFNVTRPAWRVMKDKGYGRVIMTSSGAVFGMQGNSNYVAAKAGLLGLVAALAHEGEDFGIKTNAILPFAKSMITVDSPATAVRAPDAARNVAIQNALGPRATFRAVTAATLYLASQACGISGQAISAVAGRYARSFRVVTQGWLAPEVATVSPEDVEANIAAIMDGSLAEETTSMGQEFGGALDRIKAAQPSG